MRHIEVRSEDEVSRTVLIRLQNEKTVSISLEERDACELVLVLRGYYRLTTGQALPVDQEEAPPMDDLAPPYLSQHKVMPEKWSYINQTGMKNVCFAMQPIYQSVNKKTNGLYNTMGRQCKPPLMLGYSLDSNMNNSLSNRNHQYKLGFNSFDSNSYDIQSVVSMEILESGIVEAKNDEVLKRVQEMHQLVENSEKYLNEQENLERLNALAEWQETSVDIESDTDSYLAEDHKLKHSDSLLLLTKGHGHGERRPSFTNSVIELLRSETTQSESDNDSIYTPHNSPKHSTTSTTTTIKPTTDNKLNRISFGLRSPDNSNGKEHDFEVYLRDLKNNSDNSLDDIYVFDPDIIDLTLIPPPVTPDELDCALPTPINVPPKSFADSIDKLNKLVEHQDLEEFLASVTVPPPTQKVTPAVELTPEEIMAYIIPPPPNHLTINDDNEERFNSLERRRNSNIIEYATVDRKGTFSCCAKNKSDKVKIDDKIQPLPRRCSDEKPPDRPPKTSPQERQRSQSLTSSTYNRNSNLTEFAPPKLPPRSDINHPAPSHLFLPPKKPPLPPVPPIEVLRQQKKTFVPQMSEVRTASIGSPHLQRNRNMSSDLETNYSDNEDNKLFVRQSTAVSTPTSPHLGKVNINLINVKFYEFRCNFVFKLYIE